MSNRIKLLILGAVNALMAVVLVGPVSAQATEQENSLFPDYLKRLFDIFGPDGSGVVRFITSRVQYIFLLLFIGIILMAAVYIILASVKYVRSEGDPGKMEEAQKSIKAILMGIGALFVGIVGVVIVFVIFGVNPVQPDVYQTCLSAPGSVGCRACTQTAAPNGRDNSTCNTCEIAYDNYSKGNGPKPTGDCAEQFAEDGTL